MLKVVGASWLQTRISTYILVFVALLGLAALIIGEYGHKAKKDGTYSATVTWNRRSGYDIEFWGQGNDLKTIPLRVARAYYKTGIYETGWSVIEIETSAKYPDTVQAFAAGFLEGSLTWQLIHHHWDNTVNVFCQNYPIDCQIIKNSLKENKDNIFKRAQMRENDDPFWHMVRLFYSQLNGMESGWRYAVHRSHQSVEMETEDFLWLAFQADLTHLLSISDSNINDSKVSRKGMVYLKILERTNETPLISIGHNTFGPYVRMLRLLKRYKFQYHSLANTKIATLVSGETVVMSSYPGALSSQDEFYLIGGRNENLVVAATPLDTNQYSSSIPKDQVLNTAKAMAANRLAIDAQSWIRIMILEKEGSLMPHQWIVYQARSGKLWLMEQLFRGTRYVDYTKEFVEKGFLLYLGKAYFSDGRGPFRRIKINQTYNLTKNITMVEDVRKFMRGYNLDNETMNRTDILSPVGVIDTKIVLVDANGLESLEATSGPIEVVRNHNFVWSKIFPNIQHIGHPDLFNFQSVTPLWVWK